MLHFCLTLLASLPVWAVIEYVAHRFVMHDDAISFRRWQSHALHHGAGWTWRVAWTRYVDDGVSPAWNVVGSAVVWVPLWYLASASVASAFVIVAFLHGFAWTAIHHEMHDPKGRWFCKLWYFNVVERHHREHHEHGDCNYAALFPPFMDVLCRTHGRRSK